MCKNKIGSKKKKRKLKKIKSRVSWMMMMKGVCGWNEKQSARWEKIYLIPRRKTDDQNDGGRYAGR